MIEAIQNFFKTRIEAKEGDEEKETAARVAAAALLFEAAMSIGWLKRQKHGVKTVQYIMQS